MLQMYVYNHVCEMYVHIYMCLLGSLKLEIEDIVTSKTITLDRLKNR